MIPDVIGGRYRIIEEIGRGGMGVVYLAREEGRDEPVALKVLLDREFSDRALRHFEQEFRLLTSLSHPNLIEVHDFGRVTLEEPAREVPFFTMEFVDGETLGHHFRTAGLDLPDLYRCLAQVGQALAYLHGRGLVHQDVKPSNILVPAAEDTSRRVKLMDLGLAGPPREFGEPGRIRGTPAYLSPEAARGSLVDFRSDLYSLGCVIYEILTGRPPFPAGTALGILRGHLTESPLPPSSLNRQVPPALDGLVLRLLAKDPGRRPPSADRFLRELNEVAGGVLDLAAPEVLRHRVLGGGFTGRETELAALARSFEDARRGAGRLVLVEGPAGAGKTQLLREFRVRCQIEGLDVFTGAEDGLPGAGPLAAALGRAIRGRGGLPPDVMREHGRPLTSFLGPLPGSDAVPPAPEGDERPGAGYALLPAVAAAVESLLRSGPLALAIEDLHRADETTCTLVRYLARTLAPGATGGGAPPLLLVGTYRGEEVSRAGLLFDLIADAREHGALEEIFLGPLSGDDVETMLRAMLGAERIPEAFLRTILAQTGGNPLYLRELVALLVEEGHLTPGGEESLDPSVLERADLPRRTRDLLERRVARLDEGPLQILRGAAVLGAGAIDPDAVAAITGLRWEVVARRLLEMLQAGIVTRAETEEGSPMYRFAHPGFAALVLERAPGEEVRLLHGRAVSYLERRGLPRRHGAWAELARHAEAAGQPGRAVDAYGRAGDLAREYHAHREAMEMYSRAVDLLSRDPSAPAAALCSLYRRRGEVRALIGELHRAEEDYRWMLARAEKGDDDEIRAGAHLRLGEVLSAQGRSAEAMESLEPAREIAGRLGMPDLGAEAEIGIAETAGRLGRFEEQAEHLDRGIELARSAGAAEQEVRALLAKATLLRDHGKTRESLECLDLASRRASGGGGPELSERMIEGTALLREVQGRYREALAAYEEARGRARARGDVRAVARRTANLGAVHLRVGDYDAAERAFREALDIQRRLGDREGTTAVLADLARLQMDRGRPGPALETARDVLGRAERIGKRDLLATALHLLGGILLRAGDRREAASRLEEAQRIARELRNPRLLALFLADLGRLHLLEGRPGDARTHLQEAAFLARKIGDRRLESRAMARLGEAHLAESEYERARVACGKALGLVRDGDLPRETAEAQLLQARIELTRPGGDVLSAELGASGALETFRAIRDPEGIWQAEHLAGKAAIRLGRAGEGAERIERAHRYLDALRSRLEEPLRKSFLDDPRRRDVYEDRKRLAVRKPADVPVAPAPGAGDGARPQAEAAALRKLLAVNRRLNSTRDVDELLRGILDAALDLTGAERGFLLLQEESELIIRQSRNAKGKAAEELSRSIARRALDSGEPILSTDAEEDERLSGFQSVRDLHVRSVLCVPLRVQDERVGALYLDNRLDHGLFDQLHLELVSHLADQAALALDTARMLERIEEQRSHLERLNRELEKTATAQRTELARAREELVSSRSSFEIRYRFEEMVGSSPAMQRIYVLVERLAPKKLPVLITGESGTGKELIARALHTRSDRSGGPFFTVNCAALTETLLESELFGYRKGAFTGADRNKPGYFELAHGGTIFLDEIAEMGPSTQAKFLRAIQEGEVLPVGGKSPVKVDVRIVSATNRELKEMLRDGGFREDLFYRLNVAAIHLPPLRERPDDVPLLADHFLDLLARDEGNPKLEIAPDALRWLSAQRWPGNVRQLQHLILRVATFARGPILTLRDFARYGDLPETQSEEETRTTPAEGRVESLEEMERKQIARALEAAGGNKTRAAELLGINRATLFRKLKRLKL